MSDPDVKDPRTPGCLHRDGYGSVSEVLAVFTHLGAGHPVRYWVERTLGEDRIRTHCTPWDGRRVGDRLV